MYNEDLFWETTLSARPLALPKRSGRQRQVSPYITYMFLRYNIALNTLCCSKIGYVIRLLLNQVLPQLYIHVPKQAHKSRNHWQKWAKDQGLYILTEWCNKCLHSLSAACLTEGLTFPGVIDQPSETATHPLGGPSPTPGDDWQTERDTYAPHPLRVIDQPIETPTH